MTLITSCSACSTQFFVTQAQLTANKGKVRCGQCHHVFNANQNLNEISLHENPQNEESSHAIGPAEEYVEQAAEETIDEINTESIIDSPHIEDNQLADSLPIDDQLIDQVEQAPIETLEESADIEQPSIEALAGEVTIAHPDPETQAVETTQLLDFIIRPEQVETEPSNIEDYLTGSAKLNGSRTKKIPRWLSITFIIILLPLAIIQSIYYFRTPIASQLPQAKPYLVKSCLLIGCKVELPKQLDSLAIDDSEMREDADHDHVLQFSITLLNKANVALRYPSIELTLTDASDDIVIRRTFTPSDYLDINHKPTTSNIEAGFAAKDRLHIKLALNTKDVLVAGYRLELVE